MRKDLATRYKVMGGKPLAKRSIGLRVYRDMEDWLFSMEPKERLHWLREVVFEAAKRDLMISKSNEKNLDNP